MTKREAAQLMRQMEFVFDRVRLVDGAVETQYFLDDEDRLRPEPYRCYISGEAGIRCGNCLSERALRKKGKLAKFEFAGEDVYYLAAKYIEVEDEPFVLELLSRVEDGVLFAAKGESRLSDVISNYNRSLYADPLTGAYNRRYLEEQLRPLAPGDAMAMLDMDDFKLINDSLGHSVGDAALRTVIHEVIQCVRTADQVVRYGGDEFLLVFRSIPEEAFATRLEQIRTRVEQVRLTDRPELRLTVSMGGVYRHGPLEELVEEADRKLYRAKKGKNRVCL